MTNEDIIVSVVALNGGRLIGKTRLQKTMYLLEKCGLGSGMEFEYHNFGPFSTDVAEAADFAEVEGRLLTSKHPGNHQVPYFVFDVKESAGNAVGVLASSDVSSFLKTMKSYSAIEMELAATLAYLRDTGVPSDKLDERIRDLKPSKATARRLDRAHNLLAELGLAE